MLFRPHLLDNTKPCPLAMPLPGPLLHLLLMLGRRSSIDSNQGGYPFGVAQQVSAMLCLMVSTMACFMQESELLI